jgi:hypothetical protein
VILVDNRRNISATSFKPSEPLLSVSYSSKISLTLANWASARG